MAKISPDSKKTRVIFASAAEEQFYEECLKLSDEWRVWYSRTLSAVDEKGAGLKDNEIDFVLYHPRYGVIVVEVKGGRIRFDAETQTFYSINRLDESFRIKDPFQQVLSWKSRFLRHLKRLGVKVPVSQAVSFPAVMEDELPEALSHSQDVVIGRNRLADLEASLQRLVRQSQPEQYLKFADCGDALHELLVGQAFETRLYLRDYLDAHSRQVRDIESVHETLILPIAQTARLGIEGEAGTGKTMLAMLLARYFRDQGRPVLLLGSNALLNLQLQSDLGAGIDLLTYSELASSFGVNLLIPPQDYTGAKDDWVQYEAPDRLKRAINAKGHQWQVLICDEAQDVQPFWWEAFESLIPSAEEDGRLYLFFDPGQGVFGSGGQAKFVARDVLPIPSPYFPLVHNYRTTREIAALASSFRSHSESVMRSHCGRLGYVPEIIVYKDEADAKTKLAALVRRLIDQEGLVSDEITLLSARNPAARESVLYQTEEIARLPLHRFVHNNKKSWAEASPAKGALGVSTIAGFKGLETPVGILLNVSEYNLPIDNPIMASLIYVALTRARHMLYIFLRENDPKLAAFQKALAGIKQTGTMVCEGSSSDFEFMGRVLHYNPERVGWLAVDDPAFQKANVMFFPKDVETAQIGAVKPGAKLRFRTRVEGFVTIAADLKLVQVS